MHDRRGDVGRPIGHAFVSPLYGSRSRSSAASRPPNRTSSASIVSRSVHIATYGYASRTPRHRRCGRDRSAPATRGPCPNCASTPPCGARTARCSRRTGRRRALRRRRPAGRRLRCVSARRSAAGPRRLRPARTRQFRDAGVARRHVDQAARDAERALLDRGAHECLGAPEFVRVERAFEVAADPAADRPEPGERGHVQGRRARSTRPRNSSRLSHCTSRPAGGGRRCDTGGRARAAAPPNCRSCRRSGRDALAIFPRSAGPPARARRCGSARR